MDGFAKFVFWFFILGMVMAVIGIMATMPPKARAERVISLKDGTLIVHAEVMRVRDVPREITDPAIAFQLYSGQLKSTEVDGKIISYQLGVQYTDPWSVTPVK